MALSLKESRAVAEIAELLYHFLPGSGSPKWKGHVSFKTVAEKVGGGDFWQPGSKTPIGEVYVCKRDSEGHLFAKKILHSTEEETIKRFRREVRILSSLDHPNVVRVVARRLLQPPYFYVMPLYKHSLRAERTKGARRRACTFTSP